MVLVVVCEYQWSHKAVWRHSVLYHNQITVVQLVDGPRACTMPYQRMHGGFVWYTLNPGHNIWHSVFFSVYPRNIPLKLWQSSLARRSPVCQTHTLDPNTRRWRMSGLVPVSASYGVRFVWLWTKRLLTYTAYATAYDQKFVSSDDPYNKPWVIAPMVWLNHLTPKFCNGKSAPFGSTLYL